jgi:hypothetical protein
VPDRARLQVVAEDACTEDRIDAQAENQPYAKDDPGGLFPAWVGAVPAPEQATHDEHANRNREIEQRLGGVLQSVEDCRKQSTRHHHQQAFGDDLGQRHDAAQQPQDDNREQHDRRGDHARRKADTACVVRG